MPDFFAAGLEEWKNSDEYNEALKMLNMAIRRIDAADRRLRGENVRRNPRRKKVVPPVPTQEPTSV